MSQKHAFEPLESVPNQSTLEVMFAMFSGLVSTPLKAWRGSRLQDFALKSTFKGLFGRPQLKKTTKKKPLSGVVFCSCQR